MKSIFKKIIATALCIIMMLGIAPLNGFVGLKFPELHLPDFGSLFETKASAATSGTCGDNLSWSYNSSSKTLTISGTGEMTDYYSSSGVPWNSLKSSAEIIIIEQGVTSIGNYAFNGFSSVSDLTISNNVERIGNYAFKECSGLTDVMIPEGVEIIGDYAFDKCSGLSSIVIPESVETIGISAFSGCSGIANISLHDSLIQIGSYAFNGTAFYNNEDNWENDGLYIDNCLIDTKSPISDSFAIKEGTYLIADNAIKLFNILNNNIG
ncbi:MAG: leucine-rich repeat domain-containing protein, partial [Clostridia bacterium]|nr:leucine-rich repeat domain-containing protein [Clostridia bacterium]